MGMKKMNFSTFLLLCMASAQFSDLFEDSRASKAIKKYNKQYEKNIKNTDDEDFLNFSGDGSADYDSFVVIPDVVKPTQISIRKLFNMVERFRIVKTLRICLIFHAFFYC